MDFPDGIQTARVSFVSASWHADLADVTPVQELSGENFLEEYKNLLQNRVLDDCNIVSLMPHTNHSQERFYKVNIRST